MKQILSFGLMPLQNDEHYQFHFDVIKLIQTQTAASLGIVPQHESYEKAFAEEDEAMQAERGSAFTQTILEADAYRDQVDHGFGLAIESNTYHYDPVMQENARKVMRIWEQYPDLRRLSYNKQSSATTNRNNELRTNYSHELEAMGATGWLNKSDAANSEFISHFGSRANEEAARISINVQTARAAVDPAYYALVTQVNALAVVNGDASYGEFIDRVNYYISYYKTTLASRKGRKKPTTPESPAE